MSTHIYMLAIVPPESLAQEIQDIKAEIARKYHSHEALKRPAHITVVPPFELDDTELTLFVKKISRFIRRISAFEIALDGFDSFERRVIFIRPKKTDALQELFTIVTKAYSDAYPHPKKSKPGYGFSPHITVGYRDLKPEMFDKAMHEFGTRIFRRVFTVDAIDLMQHNGKCWMTTQRIPLANTDDTPTLGL